MRHINISFSLHISRIARQAISAVREPLSDQSIGLLFRSRKVKEKGKVICGAASTIHHLATVQQMNRINTICQIRVGDSK